GRACTACPVLFYGVPIQLQLRGDIADRCAAAAAADVKSKSLGVERVVCRKLQALALHLAAPTASDTPHLELQVYPPTADPKISTGRAPWIVPAGLLSPPRPARCFFRAPNKRAPPRIRICDDAAQVIEGEKPGKPFCTPHPPLSCGDHDPPPTQLSASRSVPDS